MTIRVSWLAAMAVAVSLVAGSTAHANVVVLKEGSALTQGGTLDAAFSTATDANVVQVNVDDTGFRNNPATYYYKNYGTIDSMGGTGLYAAAFKFDLSSLAGATIEKAQLRLYENGGNGTAALAPIVTHDWTEAVATTASPVGSSTPDWGPSSDAIFTAADLGTSSNFDSCPAGPAYSVEDVTAMVQAMVSGTTPNYGWAVFNAGTDSTTLNYGQHYYFPSENADDGNRPALFIELHSGRTRAGHACSAGARWPCILPPARRITFSQLLQALIRTPGSPRTGRFSFWRMRRDRPGVASLTAL